jgi:hypothetical protein
MFLLADRVATLTQRIAGSREPFSRAGHRVSEPAGAVSPIRPGDRMWKRIVSKTGLPLVAWTRVALQSV